MSLTDGNSTVEQILEQGYEFNVTPYRWVICILLCLNSIGRSIAMIGFTSVAPILQDIYHINTLHTTMLIIPFNFAVFFLLFPYNYISNRYGLRIPTYIGVIAVVIGAWIRMFVNYGFGWVILGQVITSIGHPLTLVAPAKVAALWFGDNQRAIATMIGSLAGPVGCVIGFILPFAFIGDEDGVDTPESRAKVRNYILIQNIIVMVLSVPIFFFIKNKPEIAPSVSALKSIHSKLESNWASIKKLLKNKDYVLLMFCFSFIFAVYICFGAIMGPLLSQFHFRASANQYFGTAYVVFGVLGSMVHASILDKHKTYKKQMIFI